MTEHGLDRASQLASLGDTNNDTRASDKAHKHYLHQTILRHFTSPLDGRTDEQADLACCTLSNRWNLTKGPYQQDEISLSSSG